MKALLESLNASITQLIDILDILAKLSKDIQDTLYIEKNIGQHIRHINDHFMAVKNGCSTEVIDYNSRNRGVSIETKMSSAHKQMLSLCAWIDSLRKNASATEFDKNIKIRSEIDCFKTTNQTFKSTIARELLYLINHTIHHAAHIGLICRNEGIDIPLNTGMAPCTMSFLRAKQA